MKISVIIPVKNENVLLLNCLETLKQQDHEFLSEVIIVENGSHVFRNYDFKNPMIRYFHLPDGNRSAARNFGANSASSEIIAFLDSDTELEPGWLKEVALSFEASTLAVAGPIVPSAEDESYLQSVRFGRALERTNKTFISAFKMNSSRIVLNSAAFAIRKNIFLMLNGFDPELFRHEDLDFSQRLLRLEGTIKLIKTPKVRVFFNGGIIKYLLREYDQSFSIVRYHEKWSTGSWSSSLSALVRNIKSWYHTREKFFKMNELERAEYLISLIYFVGNVAGLLYRLHSPYVGPRQDPSAKRKAQIVFKA